MRYLHVNLPDVVHEILDGEVVVVDLANGLYFSVTSVGAWLWDNLAAGQAVETVLSDVVKAYPNIEGATEEAETFFAALIAKGLMFESPDATDSGGVANLEAPSDYVAPRIEVFSDMAELLLLDPIHDVEQEQGWPVKKA